MTFTRRLDRIEVEARLDGLYVAHTSLNAEDLSAEDAVWAYKRLGRVERAFRNLKTGYLEIRPVYVYHPTRVRAHVFLCLLALHVQCHLRRQLSPLLFEDERPDEVREQGASPAQKAQVSELAIGG